MGHSFEAGSPGGAPGFERLAHLTVGTTANVDLCRITSGEHRGKLAAVKRLLPHIASDPEFVNMFRDEMWMASSLAHPNVAQVLAWGEDDRGLFLAVEFVRGVSLLRLMKSVVATGEFFAERLVVYLAARVCEGLTAAHELRGPSGDYLHLVHRDLTPGNILLGFDGDVKISDFGLAKAKQRVTQTAIGVTKGELAYMSPEQVLGQQLDARSDLFALGVVMYELFAHQRPWSVENVTDALRGIVQTPHPDLRELCPRVDRALVALVDRCMAKDPADRAASARELRDALENWLHLHGYSDSRDSLARFVRRNSMRQMRWLDRAIEGGLSVSEEMASPFEQSRPDAGSLTPVSQTSGVVAFEGDEMTRSLATKSRHAYGDQAATVQRPAPKSADASTLVTRRRDAEPPLGAADAQPLPDLSVADVGPITVNYQRGVIEDPPTVPDIRVPARAFQSVEGDRTRLEAPRARAEISEPSSPVPLVVAAGGEALSERLRSAAHLLRVTANQLAAEARAAANEARTASERARTAAERAEQLAARAERAFEALSLAGSAARMARAGDDKAAEAQLERVQELHDKLR